MARSDEDEAFEERSRPRPPAARDSRQDDERIQDRPRQAPPERGRDRDEDRRDERDDDRPRRRPRRDDYDDRGNDALSTMIPYKNGMALAAYYLGVFSLIPLLGVILAVLAIIFGILGLRTVHQRPEAKGTGHSITGIIIGSLSLLGHLVIFMIVVLGSRR